MLPKEDPAQEELLKLFIYKDGQLICKHKRSQIKAGERAGSVDKGSGYRVVGIKYRVYYEQRLIWILLKGPIPDDMLVDHENTIKTDNRIENLRLSTNSQNCCNSSLRINNSSGYKGVSQFGAKWRAEIRINYKGIYLGLFDTPEQASEAYKKAAIQHHGEFARS